MQTTPKDVREQILLRVREGKTSVAEIARQHGVKANTVYDWLSRGVGGADSPLLELVRLKRENACLKQIIGNILLLQERGKKDSGGKRSY